MPPKRKLSSEGAPVNPTAAKRPKLRNKDKNPSPSPATSQQASVAEALSNGLIVRKILSFLSPPQLFYVRRVCKVFEEEATSLLLSNKWVQQNYSVKFPRYRISHNNNNCTPGSYCTSRHLDSDPQNHRHSKMGTLTDFVQDCWQNSRRFPVTHFTFLNCNCEEILLDFFEIVGEHITRLSLKSLIFECLLDTCSFFGSTEFLASILFEWTPNLRHLTLESTPWSPTHHLQDLSNSKKRVIPSLKTFTLEGQGSNCSFGVVQGILQSAPNLQRILDPTLKFTEVLFTCGKLHLASQVFKCRWNDETIARYLAFNEIRPGHFREISIDFHQVGYCITSDDGVALNKIFQAGRQSLDKIGMLPFLNEIPNLEPLPVMEKVTEVHFKDKVPSNRMEVKMIPEGQTLQQVFPNLTTLRLDHMKTEGDPLFQPDHVHRHDGVTSLTLESSELPNTWIQRSAYLYPNLRTLQIWNTNLENTPGMFRAIGYYLKDLEHLEVSFMPWTHWDNWAAKMDSAVTGIPVPECEELKWDMNSKRRGRKRKNVNRLRFLPSIFNLHKLKTFEIGDSAYRPRFGTYFTAVGIRFGLQPMIERQGLRTGLLTFWEKSK